MLRLVIRLFDLGLFAIFTLLAARSNGLTASILFALAAFAMAVVIVIKSE